MSETRSSSAQSFDLVATNEEGEALECELLKVTRSLQSDFCVSPMEQDKSTQHGQRSAGADGVDAFGWPEPKQEHNCCVLEGKVNQLFDRLNQMQVDSANRVNSNPGSSIGAIGTTPLLPINTSTVTLRASNGLYLSSDCLSPLASDPEHAIHVACNQNIAHAWEKFSKHTYPDGRVVLQSVKTGGVLSVDAASPEQWLVVIPPRDLTEKELFHWVELSELDEEQIAAVGYLLGATLDEHCAKRRELKSTGGWVALRGNNGRYVSSEGGVLPGATCNRRCHNEWEYFLVEES